MIKRGEIISIGYKIRNRLEILISRNVCFEGNRNHVESFTRFNPLIIEYNRRAYSNRGRKEKSVYHTLITSKERSNFSPNFSLFKTRSKLQKRFEFVKKGENKGAKRGTYPQVCDSIVVHERLHREKRGQLNGATTCIISGTKPGSPK